MKKVEKNVLVLHSAKEMFELVDKVEDYPKFLPWYSKTEVIERKGNELKSAPVYGLYARQAVVCDAQPQYPGAGNPHGFARRAV